MPESSLSEIDRLQLMLNRERAQRIEAEKANTEMQLAKLQHEKMTSLVESATFNEALRLRYELAPGDEIRTDGTIHRAAVRSLPKEG